MLDDRGVLRQGSEDMRFDQVFVLFRPTRVTLAEGAPVGSFLDCMLADGIGDHLRRLLIGRGKIDLIAEIEKKNIGLLSSAHGRNV